MTDKARLRIAAFVTALFLAAVSAAGTIVHSNPLPHPTAVVTSAGAHAPALGQPLPVHTTGDQEHD